MEQIQTKRILLGLTGGIAAYKGAELTRLLVNQGMQIQVAMTEAACHFITPLTMQALSGKPVFTHQWGEHTANHMAHINLSRATDAIIIAPATADFIAKLAHGLADDLLSTLCLARNCPLLVAPAMNRQMWESPATQRNIQQLVTDGVIILGPVSGMQACGEEGMGRMQEPTELARALLTFFQPKLLSGVKVLLTAGPTYEAIDAVRGITNRSSGKMGYAVAQAALDAGATVTLVSGPTQLRAPIGAVVVPSMSAADMHKAVMANIAEKDIFISVAAVADYTVKQPSRSKIKKSTSVLKLELAPTIDIVGEVAQLPSAPFCVGFAAESDNLREYAEAKRKRKKLPLLAGNLVQTAIGSDENELILFDDEGVHPLARQPKAQLARELIRHIAKMVATPRIRATKKTSKT